MDRTVEKLTAQIAEIKKRREATQDSKVRKRLNSQAKQKQRQLDDHNQRTANMRTGIDPKAGSRKRIPTQPDIELHHVGSSLNNARAFFEGLDSAEKLLMEREFARRGIVPGDVTMNALGMTKTDHRESRTAIHNIERDLNLEGKQYFKPGASFEEKLKAVDAFANDQRTLRKLAEEKPGHFLVLRKLVVLHAVLNSPLHLKNLKNIKRLNKNVGLKLLEILGNMVLKLTE